MKALLGDARRRQACDEYLDRFNEAVLNAVNASGEAFLSHTKIRATPIPPGETPSRQSWRWKSYCSVATRTS